MNPARPDDRSLVEVELDMVPGSAVHCTPEQEWNRLKALFKPGKGGDKHEHHCSYYDVMSRPRLALMTQSYVIFQLISLLLTFFSRCFRFEEDLVKG
jgi:hypothetical protein